MKQILKSVSASFALGAAFGGLGLTLLAFAVFCGLCLRDGFNVVAFSATGTGLVIGFSVGIVLAVAGAVSLVVLSSRR